MTRDCMRNCHTDIIHSSKRTRHQQETGTTNVNWENKQKTKFARKRSTQLAIILRYETM